MKKKFSEVLSDLDAPELNSLTSGLREELDADTKQRIYTRSAALTCADAKLRRAFTPHISRRAAIAIAACLALVIALGVGAYAYADAAEYKQALIFFENNGLVTDGLTRGEIKAVYRDITTDSFKYSKTAEVIAHNSISNSVPGWEMAAESEMLDSETAKELWLAFINREKSTGAGYRSSNIYEYHDEGDGWYEEVGSYIEKYEGENIVWRSEFDGIYVDNFVKCGKGVFAYAAAYDEADNFDSKYWLLRIDDDGNTLWKVRYGETGERVTSALAEDDGSFTLISHPAHGAGYCFGRVDADGKLITRSCTELDGQYVNSAVHYRDGYLVQFFDFNNRGCAEFVTLDRDGNMTDRFSYSSDTEYYFTKSLIEYEGRIYLSADAMPKEGTYISAERPDFVTERSCLQPALEYAFNNTHMSESDYSIREIPGLNDIIRERFTAMLLVLDPEGGEPAEFYSVKGASAGKLALGENGDLLWDCEDICASEYSPATNAFTLICTARIVRYSFSSEGKLTGSVTTDEMSRLLL